MDGPAGRAWLRPWDDAIAVSAVEVREVFQRLYVTGQWRIGDPPASWSSSMPAMP